MKPLLDQKLSEIGHLSDMIVLAYLGRGTITPVVSGVPLSTSVFGRRLDLLN